MGTVIGEYTMGHNEREASSWFDTLKVVGAVVSTSGGINSNHKEIFGNESVKGIGGCKCAKGKKDKSKCICRRK